MPRIDPAFYTLQLVVGTDHLTGLYAANNGDGKQILLKPGPDFATESVKTLIGFIAYYTTYNLSTIVVYISSNRWHLLHQQIPPGTRYTRLYAWHQLR